jgi:hypothetical protein
MIKELRTMNTVFIPALALAMSAGAASAQDGGDTLEIAKPSFRVTQEITRVVKGGGYIKADGGLDKSFILPTSSSILFQARKNQRLGLDIMVSAVYYAAPYHYDQVQNYTRNISISTPRLDASYVFGDLAHPFLKADMGVFSYKYNEYSRDLGEYMFRTWAYPGIMVTGSTYGYVGANSATVTGFKLSQSLGMFSHDFLATIETELTPVYDLNLTYMAKVNLGNVLKIGGGVQLARIVTADKDNPELRYFKYNGVWYGDSPAYYKSLAKGISDRLAGPGISAADSAALNAELAQADLASAVIDSAGTFGDNGLPLLVPQEDHQMTTQAIKPVIHFSFDPKPLLGSTLFGAQDLVLYGEASLLGAKNYPVFYNKPMERLPFMIGFNLPTFNFLNVLSLEAEYYGSRNLPTFRLNQPNATPTPVINLDSYYPSDWDKDNWKWAVCAEKFVAPGFLISGQVASDHARSWDWNYYGKTPWEIYTSPSQWYWGLKLTVAI